MSGHDQRDEVFFAVVERTTAIKPLMDKLYAAPTEVTQEHFLHVNKHIMPSRIPAGVLVVVTPANPNQCTALEYEFAMMAARGDVLPDVLDPAPEVLNRLYELLAFIDIHSAGSVGAFSTAYGARVKHIADILEEIERLYVRTYNQTGKIGGQAFYAERRRLYDKLDQALGQLLRNRVIDPRHMKLKHALGLSTRSITNTWKRQHGPARSIPEFHKHFERVARLARHLKHLGYVGIGLDSYYSYREIRKACTEGNNDRRCTRKRFTETGRLIGSVAGGAYGGIVATYAVCNVVLGLPSAGTSLLWCGILAGSAGAVAGGIGVGYGTEALGEILFEATYRTP